MCTVNSNSNCTLPFNLLAFCSRQKQMILQIKYNIPNINSLGLILPELQGPKFHRQITPFEENSITGSTGSILLR